MFTVHGTKKFLDRVPDKIIPAADLQVPTTVLGGWYVTVLFWAPQVALFVNEPTRLPLFVPLAPGASVITRMTKTASRSVLGTMNDFTYLADAHREPDKTTDLIGLSIRLAKTPCGPLYRSHVSPDREIAAYVANHSS